MRPKPEFTDDAAPNPGAVTVTTLSSFGHLIDDEGVDPIHEVIHVGEGRPFGASGVDADGAAVFERRQLAGQDLEKESDQTHAHDDDGQRQPAMPQHSGQELPVA